VSRRRLIVLIAVLAVGVALVSHPGRVAVKSLILLPNLFPNSSVRPLNWVSGEPRLETFGYEYAAGHVEADVYHPASAGRHGAVVLVPESESLRLGHVQRADADMLVQAFQRLQAMDDVDPERVGYVGFSVGGTLCLIAAEDPRIRDEVAFVNTLGAYAESQSFLEELSTRSIVVDGQRRPWEPSEHTVRMFRLQLVDSLENTTDRELIQAATERGVDPPLDRLSPQGQAVVKLMHGVAPAEFEAVRAQLPAGAFPRLDSISPAIGIADLRARLYVMHDLGDSYIPFTQSRLLVEQLHPSSLVLSTEFDIFQHVTPDKSTDLPTFAWNVAKLYRHVFAVCLEFL
jgi:hypothetical protein